MAHYFNNALEFELGCYAPEVGDHFKHSKTKEVYVLIDKTIIKEDVFGELNKPISQEPRFCGKRLSALLWKELSTGNIIPGEMWQEEDTTMRGNEVMNPTNNGYINGVRHLSWCIAPLGGKVSHWERKDKWVDTNGVFGYMWRDRVVNKSGNLRQL